MPEFDDIRKSLRQQEQAREQARIDRLGARQSLKRLEAERAALERIAGNQSDAYLKEKARLDHAIAEAQGVVKQFDGRYGGATAEWQATLTAFEPFTHPKDNLGAFEPQTPFLLMPLRLETRFKEGAQGQQQLWIRAYPDECSIDTFEELLSENELLNARRFWAEIGRAGGNETFEKAAWADLVAAHGSGRAAWIIREKRDPADKNYRPDPAKSSFPPRTADNIVLGLATENPNFVIANQAAIFTFWKAMWRAGGDAMAESQARNALNGAGLNAQDIEKNYAPAGLNEAPPAGKTRTNATVEIALVALPDSSDRWVKQHSWAQAPRVQTLPERLVFIGQKAGVTVFERVGQLIPNPLPVGIDPAAPVEDQFQKTPEGDLEVPGELRWMTDFEEAVKLGLGMRVDVEPNWADGLDRLFVLGVCLRLDAGEGKTELENLLQHHYYGRKGLSLVRQGTATNNTEAGGAAFTRNDNPDETFGTHFKRLSDFQLSNTWQQKQDGQWLSEWLGLDPSFFQYSLHADGTDQSDARAMNTALWNATLGYMMETMMDPVFSTGDIDMTRRFFSNFVLGRGCVPAIRIGAQPYGILPATTFSRMEWLTERQFGVRIEGSQWTWLRRLYAILRKIDEDWTPLFAQVEHVSKTGGDPHKRLLDIVGLHAGSVEYHYRYLESFEYLVNHGKFTGLADLFEDIILGALRQTGIQLLRDYGYAGEKLPSIVEKLADADQGLIKVIVDTVPLSESQELQKTTKDNLGNYITALIREAKTSLDALRNDAELKERPTALLFKFLKHALELGHHRTATNLYLQTKVWDAERVMRARQDSAFIHVEAQATTAAAGLSESRYAPLYTVEPAISPNLMVNEHITGIVKGLIPVTEKWTVESVLEPLEALGLLEHRSTAKLERAFAEHIDCVSYRLDAWKQGLVQVQLAEMRSNEQAAGHGDQPQSRPGIYLGAYGWLEQVKPEKNKVLTEKQLDPESAADFNPKENLTFFTDSANGGHLIAPSLNQAVTAAVLRNGYISNTDAGADSAMAVNLSSERVRLALSLIEGIQQGQSLAALLGYRLERLLHDRSDLTAAGIDAFIYKLRRAFPLVSEQLQDTKVETAQGVDPSLDPDAVPISVIEARNVVHGLNLINHVKTLPEPGRKYPFNLPAAKLPPAPVGIANAITQAVLDIMNVNDAVADLAMAESVHQVVLGNYDRAAGVLDAYGKGNYPQIPDVIQTPHSGGVITHRVGITLPANAPAPGPGANPRIVAEPGLDQWLTRTLPPMNRIGCRVRFFDAALGAQDTITITLDQLGFAPLDVLFVVDNQGDQALSELDDRLIRFIHLNRQPRPDAPIEIRYTDRLSGPGQVSVFEVMPLLESLRALLLRARPASPADMARPGEATAKDAAAPVLPRARVDAVLARLQDVVENDFKPNLVDVLAALPPEPTPAEEAALQAQIDTLLDAFAAQLSALGRFGLPQMGFGDLYQWKRNAFSALLQKVQVVRDRWEQKALEYSDKMAGYAAATNEEKLEILKAASRIISTAEFDFTLALNVVEGNVQAAKAAFDGEQTKMENLFRLNLLALSTLLSEIKAIDVAGHDLAPLDISAEEKQLKLFVLNDLSARAQSIYTDLHDKRLPAAADVLTDYATADATKQVEQLTEAARIVLGQDFLLIPWYNLPAAQGDELENAWNARDTLMDYLENQHTPSLDFPEDEWLYGVARVREKMGHVENCLHLQEAFRTAERLRLQPLQLPYETAHYHWLALPFPPEANTDDEHLLLTLLTPDANLDKTRLCALLTDEWTEVVPAKEETMGITFHYDRPNSEAPQTMLLVTPAHFGGSWQWRDLVQTLGETLDEAKKRGVEPTQIDTTPYARYLPATVAMVTRVPITMMLMMGEYEVAKAAVQGGG